MVPGVSKWLNTMLLTEAKLIKYMRFTLTQFSYSLGSSRDKPASSRRTFQHAIPSRFLVRGAKLTGARQRAAQLERKGGVADDGAETTLMLRQLRLIVKHPLDAPQQPWIMKEVRQSFLGRVHREFLSLPIRFMGNISHTLALLFACDCCSIDAFEVDKTVCDSWITEGVFLRFVKGVFYCDMRFLYLFPRIFFMDLIEGFYYGLAVANWV